MSMGIVVGLVVALGIVAGVYLGRAYEKGRRR
jgi:ABC-type phosphate transport system permease subunit